MAERPFCIVDRYYQSHVDSALYARITPNTRLYILTLSDTNQLEESFAEHLALQAYMMTLHASAARPQKQAPPPFSKLRIVQSSIEPHREGGDIKFTPDGAIILYKQDNNRLRTAINTTSSSTTTPGFDIIVGIKLLCFCFAKPYHQPKTSHSCGGVDHSPWAIRDFFLQKVIANLKNESSIAYISGGAMVPFQDAMKDKFEQLLISGAMPVRPITASGDIHITLSKDDVELLLNMATTRTTHDREEYLDGIDCIDRGIALFNKDRRARGFIASLKKHEPDPLLTTNQCDVPGFTVTIKHP